MNPNARRSAQQRVDRIAAFRAELAELEREGGLVLTPEQRARLDDHLEGTLTVLGRRFGADVNESVRRLSWGMRLATLLGGVAFGAALVLFLHRIWGWLPAWAPVPLLTAIPLLLLAAAEAGCRRRLDPYYVGLLALAAGVSFVMGLNALGSVLNAVPSVHALVAWAAFAILVAYAYGLRLILGAGLALCCAYTAAVWVAVGGGDWASFFERPACLIPAAATLYGIPWLAGRRDPSDFGIVFRLVGAGVGLGALLLLSERRDLCCGVVSARTLAALYQLAGLGLSVAVVAHGLRLGRGGLVNLGAGAFVLFLFVRLHAWWWDWMPKYLFFLSVGLIALLLLLPFRHLRRRLVERAQS